MSRAPGLILAIAAFTALVFAGEAFGVTLNYNSASCCPSSYTEQGVVHYNYYNSFGSAGHWHSGSGATGTYISGHTSCCSNLGRIQMSSGSNFTVSTLDRRGSGSMTWQAYSGNSLVGTSSISGGSGTHVFPGSFSNISRVDITITSGSPGWDNLAINACSVTSASAGGPYTVAEGSAFNASGSGSGSAALSYAWDLSGNGAYNDSTAQNPTVSSATYLWNGTTTRTIGVQVTCGSGGGATTASTTVAVSNVPPTLSAVIPATGMEASAVAFSSSVVDPGPESHTYAWTFGDGNTSTQASPTHTYQDDGTYSVTVTVDDGEATDTVTAQIVVANVNPTLQTWTGPLAGDEGAPLSYLGVGSDPSPVDTVSLVYSWDWGDGSTDNGDFASHAWVDQGSFSASITVLDPQLGADVVPFTVVIANVAPTITSSPPLFTQEGAQYSYAPVATDPGVNDLQTWTLGVAPTGMTIAPLSGAVFWTPTFSQGGPNDVAVTVDDGDGGVTTQAFTINVTYTDDDNDGMADSWETDNGLDPTIDDSALDPDGDGLSNVEEFQGGTDPNSFDGPDAPVPFAPVAGAEVDSQRPTLEWTNATDPGGDTLVYEVEIYSDATLTTLLMSQTGVSESSPLSSWWTDSLVAENTDAYWRVRAWDPQVAGPWSQTESFFVNSWNEAPETPVPLFPVDGETVGDLSPSPTWADAIDADRDALTYEIRVMDDAGIELTSGSTAGRDVSWAVDLVLSENASYAWDVRAVDPDGLASEWSATEPFFVSGDNEAPDDVIWISPLHEDSIETLSPILRATESVDPEGTPLRYRFEIDRVGTFDGEDLAINEVEHTGTGEAVWALSEDAIELIPNSLWYGRVRALDGDDVGSTWAAIEFFVRGGNDAPPAPGLLSPEDQSVAPTNRPIFVVSNVADPEGDIVGYQFRLSPDASAQYVLQESGVIDAGGGPSGDDVQTSWQVGEEIAGELFWTARSVDEHGAASEWANPWQVDIGGGIAGNCDQCTSSFGAGTSRGAFAMLLLIGLIGVRRRR